MAAVFSSQPLSFRAPEENSSPDSSETTGAAGAFSAGAATGAVARLCYIGLEMIHPGRIIIVLSVGVAALFYVLLTIKMNILTRETLSSIPEGEKIAGILERIGVLK